MTQISALHAYIHARFREAFGEPTRILGNDGHWGLRPFADAASIDVLVNGSDEFPIVWIFDTHNVSDGVLKTRVVSQDQVADIISELRTRLQKAMFPVRTHHARSPDAPR